MVVKFPSSSPSKFCVLTAEVLVLMIQITLRLALPVADKVTLSENNKLLLVIINNSNKLVIDVEVRVKLLLQDATSAREPRLLLVLMKCPSSLKRVLAMAKLLNSTVVVMNTLMLVPPILFLKSVNYLIKSLLEEVTISMSMFNSL